MVPKDAVENKDWAKITELTRSAVNKMLGLELRHVGVNSGSPEKAMEDAKKFAKLPGWEIKDGNSSTFAGTEFELMKSVGRGRNGHICIATNSVARAKWHLEQRGFAFDESTAKYKGTKLNVIYLQDEICGFAVHIVGISK
jgi:2-dehydro-3-deoxyphosphogluconate aldolase/(4S)-4-hydroxy-2-oxoglutarate aldolase